MLDSQAQNILLKENETEAFYLYATNKKEAEELKKAMLEGDTDKFPFIHQVETVGQSKLANEALANKYIPIEYYTIRKEALEFNPKKTHSWAEIEYRCYCRGKRIIENNILVHENSLSALKCAIYRIGNPEYVYVLRVSKAEIVEEINQMEKYETNSGNTPICEESTNVDKPEGETL